MKWDMGWMHDTLHYMQLDSIHRKFHHGALTFRMLYAWSEHFVLPLSHDEVVHGKGSLLAKMWGDHWQKFANLRAMFGLMYALPGKKLLFMGNELAPWREWSHEDELEWGLSEYAQHAGVQRWIRELNRLYRKEPALHERDFDSRGFEWVDCQDADQSVIAFLRRGASEEESLLVVGNFTPVPRHNYRVGVPADGTWAELANSDAETYGGGGLGNPEGTPAVPIRYHDREHSISLTLPPLSVLVLNRATGVDPLPEPAAED
jgi:1,4-alpha-glucan branching enzyme